MCARKRIFVDPKMSLDEQKKKVIEGFHNDPKVRDYQRALVDLSGSIKGMIDDWKDEEAFKNKKMSEKMSLEQELAELNRQEMVNAQELERVHWMKSTNKAHNFMVEEKLELANAIEKKVTAANAVIGKRKTQILNALGDKKQQTPIEF